MDTVRQSEERAPLLGRAESSSASLSSASRTGDVENPRSDEVPPPISRSRGLVIIISIGMLIFLTAANISILTTTQSAIAADLDAFEQATWLTSSFLIAMSALSPLTGKLSAVFSPRFCMFMASIVMTLGSIITALARSFGVFILGRIIGGAGAAGSFIIALIVVVQMSSSKNRGLYIGLANSSMTVGVSLGATIAGALGPSIGWRPMFAIQAPLSLLAGFGILFGIPQQHTTGYQSLGRYSLHRKLARVDYSGALLLISTILLFLVSLSGPRVLVIPLIFSAINLPLFVMNEVYIAKDPIIPVSVLRSRGVLLTCLATVGFMMARWTILFYTPVYALAVRNWSPAVAGSILIPTNAGFVTGGLLAGVVHIRRNGSFYAHTLVAMALMPLTLVVVALISTANSSWGLYVLMVFCNGALTGASLNYALVHCLHLTHPEIQPIVLSLIPTFRGFAGSFGSAIGGGYFQRVLRRSLQDRFATEGLMHRDDMIRRLVGSPALVGTLQGQERTIAVSAYEDGLRALFLGGVLLAVLVTVVQAGTGWTAPTKKEVQMDSEEEVEGEGLFAA